MQYPYLVRNRLYHGNITNAAETLTYLPSSSWNSEGITHILSLLSSTSISYITRRSRDGNRIPPSKEIKKVYVGDTVEEGLGNRSLSPNKLLYSLEMAGVDLRVKRMGVPLGDCENENLLDCLDVCLDFIDQGRREGAVLVHCHAGVSRREEG